MAVLTFGLYVNIDPENNVLTPQVTFVGLSLFNLLRFPLATFAMVFSQTVQSLVSNSRIKSFLTDEEIPALITEDDRSGFFDICNISCKINMRWIISIRWKDMEEEKEFV